MKDTRFLEIKELVEKNGALSGDALLATLAEHGITARDLKLFVNEGLKRDRIIRDARRVR